MEALERTDPASVGGYPLLARLGAGGMGQVYLSRTLAARPLALKTIRPDLAAVPDFEPRFAREIRNSDRVRSPWAVSVVDFSQPGHSPQWLATEYVAAPSLADWVAVHGPLQPRTQRVLAAELAAAVAAMHACGLAHRDIKPSNILLAREHPKVIDFGIARAADDSRHTSTGGVIGSPGYLAPEQATGGITTEAADVFALGAVLAFAALGRSPFQYPGEEVSAASLLYRIVHENPCLDGIPEDLLSVVARCLAKQPEQRPTAAELSVSLREAQVSGDWEKALPPELSAELAARAAEVARLCAVAPADAPPIPSAVPSSATEPSPPGAARHLPLARPGESAFAAPPGRIPASLPYPPPPGAGEAAPQAGEGGTPGARTWQRSPWVIAAAAGAVAAVVVALLLSLTDREGGGTNAGTDSGAGTTASASASATAVGLPGEWTGVWTGQGPGNPDADGRLSPRTDSFRVTLSLRHANRGEIAGKQVSNVTEVGTGREVGCTEALELREVRGDTAMFQAVTSHPTDRANTTLTCEKGRLYVVQLTDGVLVLGEEGAQSAGAPSRLRRDPEGS
ncbi:serine/threonine-protein kinase [Streptomyces sp. NRRL S-118]|uniref:serine/threonine-protein kinase n=1 Tax=Streptomyces sp. NRRL S-118 TaxID=1463881 RepID=UPI000693B963|nr:serine/threonine-protein kinase [Streptomyces sp. NRRL S-118]